MRVSKTRLVGFYLLKAKQLAKDGREVEVPDPEQWCAGDRLEAHFPVEAHCVEAGHQRKEVIDMVNSNPRAARPETGSRPR